MVVRVATNGVAWGHISLLLDDNPVVVSSSIACLESAKAGDTAVFFGEYSLEIEKGCLRAGVFPVFVCADTGGSKLDTQALVVYYHDPLWILPTGSNLIELISGSRSVAAVTYMNDLADQLREMIHHQFIGEFTLATTTVNLNELSQALFEKYPWASRGWAHQGARLVTPPSPFVKMLVNDDALMHIACPEPTASVIITGAFGFIGSHFANKIIDAFPTVHFYLLDSFSYAANACNVRAIADDLDSGERTPNVTTLKLDLVTDDLSVLKRIRNVTHVFHFAAQTHVDNSYEDAYCFTRANVDGTQRLLEAVRGFKTDSFAAFVHVSTDEVFGETHNAPSTVLSPTNPYAASKAAAEMYVLAYSSSFKIPVIITRCNNVIGPRQFPEKLVPKTIDRFLLSLPMTVHGNGDQRRTYLYIDDVVSAFMKIYTRGTAGIAPRHTYYHIGAGPSHELTTRQVVTTIALIFHQLKIKTPSPTTVSIADRPFNDARYLLDASSIHSLGWVPKFSVREGLFRCVHHAIATHGEPKVSLRCFSCSPKAASK